MLLNQLGPSVSLLNLCHKFEYVTWRMIKIIDTFRDYIIISRVLSECFTSLLLTLIPNASKQKLSTQEALAWSTTRPSLSKASNINANNPWQLLWLNTLIRYPSSCCSTLSYKSINSRHKVITQNYICERGMYNRTKYSFQLNDKLIITYVMYEFFVYIIP